MTKGRIGVGLAVALLAVSCRTPAPLSSPHPLAEGDPRPIAWMASLAQSAESRRALRAHSRLALDSPDLRFRRPQRLLARRPADLRVEVMGLFGQVAAVLVTDGERFEWLDASRGEVERGIVDDQLLWRLAQIDLSPREAVDVLLGVPLPREGLERQPGRSRGEGRIEVPFGRAGGTEQVFSFDVRGRLVGVATHDESGAVLWTVNYSAYKDVGGTGFAHEIALEFPVVDARSSIRFESVELNPDLSSDAFVLQMGRPGS